MINICNEQLKLDEFSLLNVLNVVANMIADESFIKELLVVNRNINQMSEDNQHIANVDYFFSSLRSVISKTSFVFIGVLGVVLVWFWVFMVVFYQFKLYNRIMVLWKSNVLQKQINRIRFDFLFVLLLYCQCKNCFLLLTDIFHFFKLVFISLEELQLCIKLPKLFLKTTKNRKTEIFGFV